MIAPVVLALTLLAPPSFRVEQGIAPEVELLAAKSWEQLEQLLQAEGISPPPLARPISIVSGALPPGRAASSQPGIITVRPGLSLSDADANALRHELAHQILFTSCPEASADRLFHEAFATAASGELAAWSRDDSGRYISLSRALETLHRAPHLDGRPARRALARLLSDAPSPPGRLPTALTRRFALCEAGSPWKQLQPEELAGGEIPNVDATLVLSRHSGQILLAEGATNLPLPFGSTLKPFLLAGANRPLPRLPPVRSEVVWQCGKALPAEMDAPTALLRSCNGWFLDWAARDREVVGFGRWGPTLIALGLSALPTDAAEAIGLRPSLRITPVGLAQAYRLLAEARPDLIDVLSRNAREGTLAGLPASQGLLGVAIKTGTVMDVQANPRLGWIVAVDRDLVVVMARSGRTPRTFASELTTVLSRFRAPSQGESKVQVFGLVETRQVTARCSGVGFIALKEGPSPVHGEVKLLELLRTGTALCTGGPWMVRYPGLSQSRPYAGIFTADAIPPLPPSSGAAPTAREVRARRGSELIFRTTRLLYTAGVVTVEDGAIHGEARIALARIADANVAHSRHPGRPVCDTTHCQLFQGTRPPAREDEVALAAPLSARTWLLFSRGGAEPWKEERPAQAVRAALGADAHDLSFRNGRIHYKITERDAEAHWEEPKDVPCELLRGPLKLPSCPESALLSGDRYAFEGRGAGHGEGLDIERAKRSGLRADEILRQAYGSSLRR